MSDRSALVEVPTEPARRQPCVRPVDHAHRPQDDPIPAAECPPSDEQAVVEGPLREEAPTDPSPPALWDLSPDDRPRERLLREGAHTLESTALLALVLGTGRGNGEDALQLARRVLGELGGVEALGAATPEVLQTIVGIGPVKSARIRAAFELALRAGPVEPPHEVPPPEDPLTDAIERMRGQVAIGERAVLALRPQAAGEPITLALGEGLGPRTRLGSHLARMLGEGVGPWWIFVVRPGGEPRPAEREAALRLEEAARLVGLSLERVVLIGGRDAWTLSGHEG